MSLSVISLWLWYIKFLSLAEIYSVRCILLLSAKMVHKPVSTSLANRQQVLRAYCLDIYTATENSCLLFPSSRQLHKVQSFSLHFASSGLFHHLQPMCTAQSCILAKTLPIKVGMPRETPRTPFPEVPVIFSLLDSLRSPQKLFYDNLLLFCI